MTQRGGIWSQPLTRRAAEPGPLIRRRRPPQLRARACAQSHALAAAPSAQSGFLDGGGGAIVGGEGWGGGCNPAFAHLLPAE